MIVCLFFINLQLIKVYSTKPNWKDGTIMVRVHSYARIDIDFLLEIHYGI